MTQPEIRNAVVLVIDRLGANMLGAYGSTWFETENFNRLASRSLVFDQAVSQTSNLEHAYRLLWNPPGTDANLIQRIGASGISPVLLTDEPVVQEMKLVESYDRVIPVEHRPAQQIADSKVETELAQFFAQATEWLTEMEPGSFGWLHSRGLHGSWDAPYQLRVDLANSEDPDPPEFHGPPGRMFDPTVDDPDELLGYQQVCAAQVTLIDDFLGVILDLLETDIGQSTLFCLMSTRGFPLGEHRLVGECSTADETCFAYSESVHVPLMVCLPNRPEFENLRAIRNGSLVQPNWVSEFLIDWFSQSNQDFEEKARSVSFSLPEKRREAVCTINGDAQSIQTHAWKLIRNGEKQALFAKPDDRWEVNDVSRRCPRIVVELSDILDDWIVDRELKKPDIFKLPEDLAIRTS